MVTKMVTKEPCSIFSVRLYAPTVSQTIGNTRVTEEFGGDEGDLCDHPFKALETLVSVHQELILYQKTCTRNEFKKGKRRRKDNIEFQQAQ